MIRRPYSSGFSLVEILFVIAILIAVMGSVAAFQYDVINFNRSSAVALVNTQEAQRILKTMAKELRAMESSDSGAYPIISAATSSISFFSNVDSDALKEQIRYYLNSNSLYRGVIKPTGTPGVYNPANEKISIMVTGIRNSSSTPLFAYFNNTYPTIDAAMSYPIVLTDVRLVKISLTVDSDPAKSPVPRVFSSQVQLRNLKDNL